MVRQTAFPSAVKLLPHYGYGHWVTGIPYDDDFIYVPFGLAVKVPRLHSLLSSGGAFLLGLKHNNFGHDAKSSP